MLYKVFELCVTSALIGPAIVYIPSNPFKSICLILLAILFELMLANKKLGKLNESIPVIRLWNKQDENNKADGSTR